VGNIRRAEWSDSAHRPHQAACCQAHINFHTIASRSSAAFTSARPYLGHGWQLLAFAHVIPGKLYAAAGFVTVFL